MLSDAARKALWQTLGQTEDEEPREIFALLDGARVRQLPGHLVQQDADFACLTGGVLEPAALTRAPFIARVAPDKPDLLDWLSGEGWGQSWGIYALAPRGTDLDIVLRDLREALSARLPDGRIVHFRFFDPRVWRPFFPTCDATQMKTLFGRAVTAFACEDEKGRGLFLDTVRGRFPHRQIIPLP